MVISCAIQSSPTGGEKDTTPPQVVREIPTGRSTNINIQSLVIEFDEYIEVRDFSRQFLSSPPIDGKIKQTLKGKRLILEWSDTLLPNTTYTFSFGNCIKDITEGNAQTEYKYVFSTGEYLDSQFVSGKVIDAYTNQPIEGALVGLYPSETTDSAIRETKPTYYSLTNKEGRYDIENIKLGDYRVLAFQDIDFNYIYSGNAEMLGFPDSIINSSKNPTISLSLSKPLPSFKFYRARYKDFGQAQFFFNAGVQDLQIENLDQTNQKSGYLLTGEKADTLTYWFQPVVPGDSLIIQISSESQSFIDTIRLNIATKDTTKFILTSTTKTFTITPGEKVRISSSTPIHETIAESILLNIDSNRTTCPYTIVDHQHLDILPEIKNGQKAELILLPGAIRDLYGRANPDTMIYKIACPLESDLAILRLNIQSASKTQKIIEIYNKAGIAYHTTFRDQLLMDIPHLRPGTYDIRVIYDSNEDGIWNPAKPMEKIQPERVIYHPSATELRANWELDLNWSIQ